MKYLKFTQYIYLAASLFFGYTAIIRFQAQETGYWLWFVIAFLCFFLFLFRRNFAKKFEKRKKEKDQNSQPKP